MELKLTLLLLSAMLLVELSIQRPPKAGGPKAWAARNAIKLCGDTLKLAIISSCGASRWKREALDPSLPDTVPTGSKKFVENMKLQSDPELKEPQGDSSQEEEPLESVFIDYYEDNTQNIPETKEDPALNSADLENDSELKRIQRDHPPNTEQSRKDFIDNKKYSAEVAKDDEWGFPDNGLGNPTGSDFVQTSIKTKRDDQLEMAMKCCSQGCSAQDIVTVFCE